MATQTALSCWLELNFQRICPSLWKNEWVKSLFSVTLLANSLSQTYEFKDCKCSFQAKFYTFPDYSVHIKGVIKKNYYTATEWGDWLSCVWYEAVLKLEPEKHLQKHSELGQHHWNKGCLPVCPCEGCHHPDVPGPISHRQGRMDHQGIRHQGMVADCGKLKTASP